VSRYRERIQLSKPQCQNFVSNCPLYHLTKLCTKYNPSVPTSAPGKQYGDFPACRYCLRSSKPLDSTLAKISKLLKVVWLNNNLADFLRLLESAAIGQQDLGSGPNQRQTGRGLLPAESGPHKRQIADNTENRENLVIRGPQAPRSSLHQQATSSTVRREGSPVQSAQASRNSLSQQAVGSAGRIEGLPTGDPQGSGSFST
jgi:hypothetical protein